MKSFTNHIQTDHSHKQLVHNYHIDFLLEKSNFLLGSSIFIFSLEPYMVSLEQHRQKPYNQSAEDRKNLHPYIKNISKSNGKIKRIVLDSWTPTLTLVLLCYTLQQNYRKVNCTRIVLSL